jgi:hypothetical protein
VFIFFMDPRSSLYVVRRRVILHFVSLACGVLGIILWIDASTHLSGSRMLWRSRNFYGVLTVYQQGSGLSELRLLHHGSITHGLQLLSLKIKDEPTTYYGRHSGVGLAFASLPNAAPRRFGVIGLGAGTVATYGVLGDVMRFYEINPMVIQLAQWWFTFLADSPATIEIVPGDARLSLEAEKGENFDLLIVDAFSGDAIPVHLLTAECVQLYLRHLARQGIIAIHISNKHLYLEPVVRALAANAGLSTVGVQATGQDPFDYDSDWMLLARDPAVLQRDPIRSAITPPASSLRPMPVWTDDYSDLIRILR